MRLKAYVKQVREDGKIDLVLQSWAQKKVDDFSEVLLQYIKDHEGFTPLNDKKCRMAYELKLTPRQYNYVYEVNYDFINNFRYLMDDVVRGYDYALERYYDFLDVRNDDLRWILSSAQYRRFMRAEHFYRPIYAHENKWHFRIYLVYNNVNFFLLWQTASLC